VRFDESQDPRIEDLRAVEQQQGDRRRKVAYQRLDGIAFASLHQGAEARGGQVL
jgi:hypothetical protein